MPLRFVRTWQHWSARAGAGAREMPLGQMQKSEHKSESEKPKRRGQGVYKSIFVYVSHRDSHCNWYWVVSGSRIAVPQFPWSNFHIMVYVRNAKPDGKVMATAVFCLCAAVRACVCVWIMHGKALFTANVDKTVLTTKIEWFRYALGIGVASPALFPMNHPPWKCQLTFRLGCVVVTYPATPSAIILLPVLPIHFSPPSLFLLFLNARFVCAYDLSFLSHFFASACVCLFTFFHSLLLNVHWTLILPTFPLLLSFGHLFSHFNTFPDKSCLDCGSLPLIFPRRRIKI